MIVRGSDYTITIGTSYSAANEVISLPVDGVFGVLVVKNDVAKGSRTFALTLKQREGWNSIWVSVMFNPRIMVYP